VTLDETEGRGAPPEESEAARVGRAGRAAAPVDPPEDACVAAMVEVATRDTSIGRVLREICGLPSALRATALDLVGAQLRTRAAGGDVFECLDSLKRDEIAGRIAERLGPPG
jgi:hypothetical protein